MSQNPRNGPIGLLTQFASILLFIFGGLVGLGGTMGLIGSWSPDVLHPDRMPQMIYLLQMIFGVLCWIVVVLERIHHAVCRLIPERPAEPRQPPPPVNRPMAWPQD